MRRFPKPDVLNDIDLSTHRVIEASAGTGKTYTLEHIVLDIIMTYRVPIASILILTYTERATTELRARVRSIIADCLAFTGEVADDEPHWKIDDDTYLFLRDQFDQFSRAPIFTIHGFCHRVLDEHAFYLGRSFDEERQDSKSLFDQAFKRALRTTIANDREYASYLEAWLEKKSAYQLQNDLLRVAETDDPIVPLFNERKIRELAIAVSSERRAVSDFAQALPLLSPYDRDKVTKDADVTWNAAVQLSLDSDIVGFLKRTDAVLHWRGRDESREALFNDVAHAQPSTNGGALLKKLLLHLVPLKTAILSKLRPIAQQFLAEEKARGFFDFNDMLTGVWNVLERDDELSHSLATSLRGRYRYALVDEFQDTDTKQWAICRKVFFENPDNNTPLIVIGDPKQSIYSWRGADVNTYLEAKETLQASTKLDAIQLTENYRSTTEVVAAYNAVFDQTSEPSYFEGPTRYDAPVESGKPKLRVVDADGKPVIPIELITTASKTNKVDAFSVRRDIARWMAYRIRQIVQNPHQIDDDGVKRFVEPDSIFILTRTGEEGRFIARYLREFDVKFAFFKQEGLFQSDEADDIMAVLLAIEQPYSTTRRLQAWATPFFGIPLEELDDCRSLRETDAPFADLLVWSELARRREFEAMFAKLLDESGLIRRLLFNSDSERAKTNYAHIFEILLEEVHTSRLDITDLVVRFANLKKSRGRGDQRNVQRRENASGAVQIMTVYASKGLEADIVFVFGGFSKNRGDQIKYCYRDKKRLLYVGRPQSDEAYQLIKNQQRQEDQRLYYVALTRARFQIYLPYITPVQDHETFRKLNGSYEVVNDRLRTMSEQKLFDPTLFHKSLIVDWLPNMKRNTRVEPWKDWTFDTPESHTPTVDEFRPVNQVMSSYSRLKKSGFADDKKNDNVVPQRFVPTADQEGLPPGTASGILMHDILEHTPFEPAPVPYGDWLTKNRRRIEESFAKHNVELEHFDWTAHRVYLALTTSFSTPDGDCSSLNDVTKNRREVEFHFPIPSDTSSLFGNGSLQSERGFLKGYIDLVLEFDGRIYFLDWKTDSLESWDQVNVHVVQNYEVQAQLYTQAMGRMFGLTAENYDRRFGGYIYCFLRNLTGDHDIGFYCRKPSLSSVAAYRQKLVDGDIR